MKSKVKKVAKPKPKSKVRKTPSGFNSPEFKDWFYSRTGVDFDSIR